MVTLPNANNHLKNFSSISKHEKLRAQNFVRLKEYEHFYLYGKISEDGRLLYRECFSKFDIDGVKNEKKPRRLPFKGTW